MKLKVIIVCWLCSISFSASAGEAREQLDAFHKTMQTFEADFAQKLVSDKGEVRQQVSGKVYLQRPGLFRWDYSVPYEQMIMADRRKLTIYDADLEQVTIRAIDESISQTPAVILTSDSDLDENFYIFELDPKDGMQRVELAPRGEGSSFVRVKLGFRNSDLVFMDLEDSFGQNTIIHLTHIKRNQALPKDVFEFEIPEGVDVVGDLD